MKSVFSCFAAAVILMHPSVFAESGTEMPLKPFHLRFVKYAQNPADGSFTFQFRFADLPAPRVDYQFKIGDVIGRYEIVGFSQKIEKPHSREAFGLQDVSELTFQNLTSPSEKVLVRFQLEYNIPQAGILSPKIGDVLSRYKIDDEVAPLIAELHLTGRPSFSYPNLPAGEEMTDYFLPDGTVRISTRWNDNARVVLSSAPFFVEDHAPIAERLKKYNQSMDDYVKQSKGK